jgi:proline dehydrogenase
VEWTHNLNMEDVWNLIRSASPNSPVAELQHDMPDEKELQLLRNLLARLDKLVTYAAAKNIRLMIDAEQTYFQLASEFVTGHPKLS